MSWNAVRSPFCEGILRGGFPEPISAITSMFMVFLGMWVLAWRVPTRLLMLVYIILTINGFGSALYHYYGYKIYGYFDAIPMIILSWLLAIVVINTIKAQNLVYAYVQKISMNIFILGIVLSPVCVYVQPWDEPSAIWFNRSNIFIGIQLINVVLITMVLLASWKKVHCKSITYLVTGMLSIILASSIWMSTERKCEQGTLNHPALKFTHGIWHICMSYGFHLIIQVTMYITASISFESSTLVFRTSDNKYIQALLHIFPIVSR